MKQSNQHTRHTKMYILMLLVVFFWASAFIAAKFTTPYIPACTVTVVRFAIAIACIYLMKNAMEKKNPETAYKLKKEDVTKMIFTGIVGMIGYHVLFFLAVEYTSTVNSSIIRATDPVITVILAFVFLHQKVKPLQLGGILLSLLGVLLTITSGDLSYLLTMGMNKGDLFMIGAVLSWAAYSVYSKSKCGHIPPIAITYYSFWVCFLVLIPFSIILDKPWEWIGSVPMSAWVSVVYMALFCSALACYMQQMAVQEIGPTRSAIFINLIPVCSTILAFLILHETLEPVKIFTALLSIAGVCICQLAGNRGEK